MGKDRNLSGSNQTYNYNQKNKQKNNNKKWNEEIIPVLTPEQHRHAQLILERSIWLGKEYQAFRYKKNDFRWVKNNQYDFFEEWLPYYISACEVDLLAGKLAQNQVPQKDLTRAPTEEIFFKSYDFFKDYNWPARFTSKPYFYKYSFA